MRPGDSMPPNEMMSTGQPSTRYRWLARPARSRPSVRRCTSLHDDAATAMSTSWVALAGGGAGHRADQVSRAVAPTTVTRTSQRAARSSTRASTGPAASRARRRRRRSSCSLRSAAASSCRGSPGRRSARSGCSGRSDGATAAKAVQTVPEPPHCPRRRLSEAMVQDQPPGTRVRVERRRDRSQLRTAADERRVRLPHCAPSARIAASDRTSWRPRCRSGPATASGTGPVRTLDPPVDTASPVTAPAIAPVCRYPSAPGVRRPSDRPGHAALTACPGSCAGRCRLGQE